MVKYRIPTEIYSSYHITAHKIGKYRIPWYRAPPPNVCLIWFWHASYFVVPKYLYKKLHRNTLVVRITWKIQIEVSGKHHYYYLNLDFTLTKSLLNIPLCTIAMQWILIFPDGLCDEKSSSLWRVNGTACICICSFVYMKTKSILYIHSCLQQM